jgi:hypothetical protein
LNLKDTRSGRPSEAVALASNGGLFGFAAWLLLLLTKAESEADLPNVGRRFSPTGNSAAFGAAMTTPVHP